MQDPTCRAAISDGTITLNSWRRGMAGHGPARAGLATVDVALADLVRLDDDELIVVPVRGVRWTYEAECALVDWAERVGYARLWLPDRVVELAALATCGLAFVTCPTCSAEWDDGGPEFWEGVRCAGWFPGSCLACGGSLPEWSVLPAHITERQR